MDGSLDQLVNFPPEVREALQNGALSFAVNVLSNDYVKQRAYMQDERLKRLKFEAVPGDYDIERGVRKAQLWATYKVARHAAETEPRHQDYFNGIADMLRSEIDKVDRDDYTFTNMPSLDKGEIKKLLPGVSIGEDELGWRLKLTTLAELKQRFGSEQAFDTLQRLLLGGWQEGERSFDWFGTFSTYFAEERKDNPDLRAAFDGYVLTEMANQLELNHRDVLARLEGITDRLAQVIREDGASTRAELKRTAEGVGTLLEQSKPNEWFLPPGALTPDASHLPRIKSDFVFPLSLGVEETNHSTRDGVQILTETRTYGESRELYRRRRVPKLADTFLGEWARQPGLYVVTGEPGGGKTTLLGYWAKELHQTYLEDDSRAFPLYVSLREMRGTDKTILHDQGVQRYFNRKGLWGYEIDVSPYWSGERRAIWLLDGWDELEPTEQEDWLTIARSLKGTVIVSCRAAQYQGNLGPDHLIIGLSKEEQARFLKGLIPSLRIEDSTAYANADTSWRDELLGEVEKHHHLRELASNPLLLTLIARTNPPGKVQLPRNREAFYGETFDYIVKRRLPDLNYREKRDLKAALKAVASRAQLDLVISEDVFWSALDEVNASSKVEERAKSCGILQPKGSGYEFLHATFQEWFLAQTLAQSGALVDALEAHWRKPNYEETLALLWSMEAPDERFAATKFLLNVGCQSQVNQGEETQGKYKRSGIRTALHLWHRSGLPVESKSLEQLWNELLSSNTPNNLRVLAAARNDRTPVEILKLMKDKVEEVRLDVASNPNATEMMLLELMKDEIAMVRRRVASNSNATELMLLELMNDKDMMVRRRVASNSNATEPILLELMKDENGGVRQYVASNPNATEAVLLELTKDKDKHVRQNTASNPNATEVVLLELMNDEDVMVRWHVDRNPNATESMLRELVEDGGVHWSIARNPNAAEAVLLELMNDEDKHIHRNVARNSTTTEAVLLKLIKDKDKYVRRGVARNPNATETVLLELMNDEDEYVRQNVASNSNATEVVLLELTKDKDTMVRRNVVSNPTTTEAVLIKLTRDENKHVREAVATNLNTCLEWL